MPKNAVKLSAESDYQNAGKQYIGRVTGVSGKWGVALDFVGLKSGKRGDVTTFLATSPGCYKVHDASRRGGSDHYWLIWTIDDVLVQTEVTEEDVALLAQDLSEAAVEALGRRAEIARTEESLSASRGRDPEALVDVEHQTAAELRISPGKTRRADLVAAREIWLHRLRQSRSELARRRSEIRLQIEFLERELAEIDAALEESCT